MLTEFRPAHLAEVLPDGRVDDEQRVLGGLRAGWAGRLSAVCAVVDVQEGKDSLGEAVPSQRGQGVGATWHTGWGDGRRRQ